MNQFSSFETLGSRLDGRVHIVTGACGGIGRAVCHALAGAGASVAATDLSATALNALRVELPGEQPHVTVPADITNLGAHDELVARTVNELGRLDGLVHVAAVIRRRDLDEVTEEDWDVQLDVNLKAAFFLNLAVARRMRTTGGGAITNFTSQAWWSGGLAGSVVYAASKAGVVAMSRGLAREFASREIRVNTVAPGIVDTPMMYLELTDEQREWAKRSVPLGRMAEPEEVAGLTVFLASDQARYITGASISVSGGQFMY